MARKAVIIITMGVVAIVFYYTAFNPFPTSAATAGVVASVSTTPVAGGSGCVNGAGQTFTITTGSGTATITGTVAGNTITSFVATPTAGGSTYTTGTKPVTGASCTGATVEILTVSSTDSVTVTGRVTAGIAITVGNAALDLGDIDGFNGGYSSGVVTWTVKTNNATGYTVHISKNQLFMTGAGGAGKQFTDLAATPYYGATPGITANNTGFGFAINALSGPTAGAAFVDAASTCGAGGTFSANVCWAGIPASASPLQIAAKATKAADVGDTVGVTIRADIGLTPTTSFLESGDYTNVVTMTSTMQ
jgi:hypothetical protein